ncbi:MAG: hypothetical protein U0R52_06865 [Solirubrobacterales bacterium]
MSKAGGSGGIGGAARAIFPALLASLFAAFLASLYAGAPPAGASGSRAATTVLVSTYNADNPPFFIGEVRSPRKACARQRKVTLYGVRPGPDKRYGSAKTIFGEGTWAWIIKAREAGPGFYYAKAEPTAACRGDRSPNFRVL